MIKNKESHSYIYDYTRTAIGAFQGSLSSIKSTDLGACVIKELVTRNNLDKNKIESVTMGNVLSANLGQAPARQAVLVQIYHIVLNV